MISRVEAAMIAYPEAPGPAPPLDVSSLNLVPSRCCTGKCVEVKGYPSPVDLPWFNHPKRDEHNRPAES